MSEPFPLMPAEGGGVDPEAVELAVAAWIAHPAFRALTADFGWPEPAGHDLASRLAELEEHSLAWDFRGGRERNQAAASRIDEHVAGQVLEAARALGLRDAFERPSGVRYEHCLVLGGLVRACVLRPQWAAQIADGVSFGEITALGAFRPLAGDEPGLASEAGLDGVDDELGAMDAGVRRALDIDEEPEVEGEEVAGDPSRSWTVRRYEREGMPVSVVAAPSGEPGVRRANTGETYAWWASRVAHLGPEDRVLLVTSSIYVPYQHADAVRMLAAEYGCAVETIGVPHQVTGGMSQQEFGPQQYLQEMRSTIRAFRALVTRLRARDDGSS